MKYILTIFFSFSFLFSFGQSDTSKTSVAIDALLANFLNGLPKEMHKEFIDEYNKMSADRKKSMLELMDVFSSMPTSSKKQLTQNVDTNYSNILAVKTFFKNIVPTDYSIYIEFNPPKKVLKLDESIDFWVFRKDKKNKNSEIVFQEWNIELKSAKIDSLLNLTTLKRKDLQDLKQYLDKANCISVSNMGEVEIGYARSGMGKYSYLIFDKPLSKEDQKKYNNGCEHIFYKDNIVLEYGSGAIGSLCFPDKE
jgi:hypothetical protein